jgi:nitrate reductase NapE component
MRKRLTKLRQESSLMLHPTNMAAMKNSISPGPSRRKSEYGISWIGKSFVFLAFVQAIMLAYHFVGSDGYCTVLDVLLGSVCISTEDKTLIIDT